MKPDNNRADSGLIALTRWVLSYAIRRWRALTTVLSTHLAKLFLDVLRPWPMLFLVDYVLRDNAMPGWLETFVESLPGPASASALVGWSVGVTVVLFLLGWVVGVLQTCAGINLGQRMVYDLASDVFARLQQLSLRFHARRSVGDNIRRVTSDCECVATILRDALLPALSSLATLVVMFSILWRLSPSLTLYSMAVVPFMVIVFHRYAQPMLEGSYQQEQEESRIYEVVEETFSAIPVVQLFCREKLNEERFSRFTGGALAAALKLTRIQLHFKILMGMATALGTAAIVWFGARLALQGDFTIGEMLLFLSYLGSLYAPLEAVMYTSSTVQGAAGSARRVREVLHTHLDVADQPGAVPLARVRGTLRFERVTFGYEQDRPVLHEVELELRAGERVALVGATGAGKSTLVALVPRFFDPWQGRVLIGGQDLRGVQLKSLRQQVGIVLQESFLFPMSIAENIAYGRQDARLADIEAAARAAHAHEFISELPQGYRTVIGERGATLSVGQRQRLSIARALLKDAPVLILDEPTSALDAETEQGLLDALDRLAQDRTTLIIAHRLSTVRRADRIVVLDGGRIIETGTHTQLVAAGGAYARLHALQFRDPATGNQSPTS